MFPSSILAFLGIVVSSSVVSTAEPQTGSAPTNPSGSFNLILESTNSTLDGSYLQALHAGAGIEELVVGSKNISSSESHYSFDFNQTRFQDSLVNVTGILGTLAYTLQGVNFNYSQALGFSFSLFYDVAVPQFGGSAVTTVGFLDDYLKLSAYNGTATVAVDKWYVCQYARTQTAGYSYFALAWKLGSSTPDNDSCQKVCVKRVYA